MPANHPLELYRKILSDEFIRELQHLLDVASGRAQEKADFTDKLLSAVGSKVGEALGSLPGGDWLASALEYALDWGNALRKQKKSTHAERQGHQIEALRLRIVIDTVAMEAARRHQFFISEYLDPDAITGLIPFAKAGVERMLEYVLRRELNLHEAHLLMGLMHGRSGRYVSGYTNTELKVKPGLAKKSKRHTAEGAYGRSAYVNTAGRLYKIDKRTNFLDKSKDPKYGYIQLPQATLEAEAAIIQPRDVLSPALKDRLSKHQAMWVTITKTDIAEYLKIINPKSPDNPSLLNYLAEKHHHPIERFFYVGDATDDWDLTAFNFAGADLSHGVFNHCVFANSLNHTQFNNTYLRQADFSRVEGAHQASFKHAHMEFMNAEGIDFAKSDFTQAHCEYGNFKRAKLEQCQTLGAQWLHAELEGIKLDNPAALEAIERSQAEQLKRIEAQAQATEALNERLSAQQAQIEQLQTHLKAFAQTVAEQAKESITDENDSDAEADSEDPLVTLQALNEKLLQEQSARLAFERYCEHTLQTLTQDSQTSQETQAEQAAQIKQLQDTLTAIQSQDETFQTLIDKLSSQLSETNRRVKDNRLDIEDIKRHIETTSIEINTAIEKQAKDLAALTHRVDKVERRLDQTDTHLGRHDKDIEQLKAHLGPEPKTKIAEIAATVKVLIKTRYADDKQIQGVFGKALSMDEQGGYVNLQMIFTGKIEKQKTEPSRGASAPDDATGNEREARSPDTSQRDERLSSFEDLFGEKRVLKLEDAFKSAKDVLKSSDRETLRLDNEDPNIAPNLLLLQGRAGIGKTTCVRYCANQWSAGKLWGEVAYLFVLTFRGLRSPGFMKAQAEGEQLPLWEWVYRNSALKQGSGDAQGLSFQAQGIKKEAFEAFWDNLIKTESHKIAFLLDGLDEAPLEHPCLGAFHSLLNDEAYSRCKVIITSRPGTGSLLPKQRRDLEVVGLTNDNIEAYIQQFFAGREMSDATRTMMQALKSQPTLWGMAHIPVTLNLMCGLFDEGRTNLADLHSMSGLYYQMESKLLTLAAKRSVPSLKAIGKRSIDDIDEHLKQEQVDYARAYYRLHREVLAQLALRGLQSEQIILPIEWLDEAISQAIKAGKLAVEQSKQLREEVLSLGLVKYTSTDDESALNSGHLEFMHLTFQEYYAAVAVSSVLIDTATNPAMAQDLSGTAQFINDALLNPHYQIMFWLVMGLLKEAPQALGQFFERLIDESNPSRDIIGEYRLGLLARGIEEVMPEIDSQKHNPHPLAGLDPKTQRKLFATLLARLNGWYSTYQANRALSGREGLIIQSQNSYFFQMLSLSPNVSTQLSLMPDNTVLSHLKSRHHTNRRNACTFIGAAKYVSPMILSSLARKVLDKDKEDVRRAAAEAIGNLGAAAAMPEFLAGLLTTLRDEDRGVRRTAAEAIGNLGAAAATPEFLAGLLTALRDENVYVRFAAVQAIGALGAAAATPEFLADLLTVLRDEDRGVRRTATQVIGALGPAAATPDILEGLRASLRDEDRDVRCEAAEAIGYLGSAAATPDILAGLGATLRYEELDVYLFLQSLRVAAAEAIGALGSAAATPDILEGLSVVLRDENVYVRRAAARAIGELGSAAATPDILAGLSDALCDKNEYVRNAAARAIGALGPAAAMPEFLAGLRAALRDEDKDVRCAAAEIIGNLGPAAATPEILEGLRAALRDEERDVRLAAAQVIGALGPAAATPDILEGLRASLRDEDKHARFVAAVAIGKLGKGSATPEFLAGLRAVLRNKDWRVSSAATDVLINLGKSTITTSDIDAGLKQLKESTSPSYLFMMLYASLCQNVSVSIIPIREIEDTEEDKPYRLQMVSSQQHISYPLTVIQAQALRHYLPIGINLLFTQAFDKAAKEFEKACQKQLPPVAGDPLMRDQFSMPSPLSGRTAAAEPKISMARTLSNFGLMSGRKKSIESPFGDTNNIFFQFHHYLALKQQGEDKGRLNDFQTLLRCLQTACTEKTVSSWIKTTFAHPHHRPFKGARYHDLRQALEKQKDDASLQAAFKVYVEYLNTGLYQGKILRPTEPVEILRGILANCVAEPEVRVGARAFNR